MLQNNIHPLIENTIRTNGGEFNREEVRFQQDGAPPHYDVNVRGYLNVHFREKWIGRRGAIEWPARSPDLNPLDFFLWGHLKSVIYCTPVACVEDLRNRITEACRKVTPEILTRVRSEFVNRLYYCQEVTGNQYEHLLQ
uniref:Tc1-like transposase DDE domain-containing protein n=1 Tax=Homalodisca liturata TaxID=320908 RepID=A0A1B6JM23_9HEMI